jgi:hypothetical protein
MIRFAAGALSLLLSTAGVGPAAAELVVSIDKSAQRMTVLVNGAPRHTWLVSTGTGGGPPSGTYRPQRLERKWYSRKFNWSPMPHAVFFHEGYAIHGTYYLSRLGRRASHGCVRLHPANAAALFALVQGHGKANTRIVIANYSTVAMFKRPPARAKLLRRPSATAASATAPDPTAAPAFPVEPMASPQLRGSL